MNKRVPSRRSMPGAQEGTTCIDGSIKLRAEEIRYKMHLAYATYENNDRRDFHYISHANTSKDPIIAAALRYCIHTYVHTYINTYIYTYTKTLHDITLHYITLHYITRHYGEIHYITLHCIALHYITLYCIKLHHITVHYITSHLNT